MPLLLFSDRFSIFLIFDILSLSLFSLAQSPRSEQSTSVEKDSLLQKLFLLLLCVVILCLYLMLKPLKVLGVDCCDLCEFI